ncbi:hypothetical protein AAY473_038450 [Plecturocebus cupreus]
MKATLEEQQQGCCAVPRVDAEPRWKWEDYKTCVFRGDGGKGISALDFGSWIVMVEFADVLCLHYCKGLFSLFLASVPALLLSIFHRDYKGDIISVKRPIHLLCCPGWSAVVQSGFTATSFSQVQAPFSASRVAEITGFRHVGQAGFELLTSSDPPTWASQSAGITCVSHAPGPLFSSSQRLFPYALPLFLPFLHNKDK